MYQACLNIGSGCNEMCPKNRSVSKCSPICSRAVKRHINLACVKLCSVNASGVSASTGVYVTCTIVLSDIGLNPTLQLVGDIRMTNRSMGPP